MTRAIRVLVVDDSAFIRKVFRQILSRAEGIEVVGTAADGDEALALVERLHPDVVTLDLNMPDVDGVQFVKRQMARTPIPIVICSVAHASGAATLAALDAGAVDFVQKPTALATDLVFDLSDELVSKVRTAANVELDRLRPGRASARAVTVPPHAASVDIVVIGLSTGGPQALRAVIPRLPANFPAALAVVLHMPVGYTELYAHRLNEISALDVVEAQAGTPIVPGRLVVARAGEHLRVTRATDASLVAALSHEPLGLPHRPAVDVLFESAARACGGRVLGVVMTGMGNDGLAGSRSIKSSGGRVVTESAESCVVYGMPRSVEEAGLSDFVVSLENLPNLLAELV